MTDQEKDLGQASALVAIAKSLLHLVQEEDKDEWGSGVASRLCDMDGRTRGIITRMESVLRHHERLQLEHREVRGRLERMETKLDQVLAGLESETR